MAARVENYLWDGNTSSINAMNNGTYINKALSSSPTRESSLNPNYSYATNYNANTDYQKMINDSVKNNDYAAAAAYEQARNLKLASEGLPYSPTNNYQSYAGKGVNDGSYGSYNPNSLLNDYKAQQEALIRAQTQAGVDRLKSQIPGINESYDQMAQEAYIQNMLSKRDLPQQLSASGLTGGVSESSNIALQTQYGNALNQGELARRNAVRGIENSIVDLQNTGDMSLAQAGSEYAKMAMEDYYRALEQQNYLDSFNYQKSLDEYGKTQDQLGWDYKNKVFDYDAEQDAYERALKEQQMKASLAGRSSGGSSSGYSSGGGSSGYLSDAAQRTINTIDTVMNANQGKYSYNEIAGYIENGLRSGAYGAEVARELANYYGFSISG